MYLVALVVVYFFSKKSIAVNVVLSSCAPPANRGSHQHTAAAQHTRPQYMLDGS